MKNLKYTVQNSLNFCNGTALIFDTLIDAQNHLSKSVNKEDKIYSFVMGNMSRTIQEVI